MIMMLKKKLKEIFKMREPVQRIPRPDARILSVCAIWAQGGYTDHEAIEEIVKIITE